MTTLAKRPGAEELRGLFQYYFEAPGGLEIECWLEYEPEQAATDTDPSFEACTTLVFALINDYDIENLLRMDVVAAIEHMALEYRYYAALDVRTSADDIDPI